jgi:hypothetical protein
MKRIVKIVLSLILIFMISAGIIIAQEKKTEQRVKVVVIDKSGTKVQIDTLIKGTGLADSIKLKDGEVIYITNHASTSTVKSGKGEKGETIVMVTSDDKGEKVEKGDKGEKKIVKEITIISGDSASVRKIGDDKDVIVVKGYKIDMEGKDGNVTSWSTSSGNSKGEKHIYLHDEKGEGKEGNLTYNVEVTTDEKGGTSERMKYVIAKDGMVVSVEGDDEAKVKDMVKEIEAKLGINKSEDKNKQTTKEESKKAIKK